VNNSWIVVIGTLGGVVVTATAGLITAYLSSRQRVAEAEHQARLERQRQIRDERRAIFVEYLSAYRTMYSRALEIAAQGGAPDNSSVTQVRVAMKLFERTATAEALEYSRTYYTVTISASKETREAADEATRTLWELAAAAVTGNQPAVEEADSNTAEPRRRLRSAMRADLGID
jgi:hypothetical protein